MLILSSPTHPSTHHRRALAPTIPGAPFIRVITLANPIGNNRSPTSTLKSSPKSTCPPLSEPLIQSFEPLTQSPEPVRRAKAAINRNRLETNSQETAPSKSAMQYGTHSPLSEPATCHPPTERAIFFHTTPPRNAIESGTPSSRIRHSRKPLQAHLDAPKHTVLSILRNHHVDMPTSSALQLAQNTTCRTLPTPRASFKESHCQNSSHTPPVIAACL